MFYTTILHEARKKLGISCNEYCIADMIHRLSGDPSNPVRGWCYASKTFMAEEMGLCISEMNECLESLATKGIIEYSTYVESFRATEKWTNAQFLVSQGHTPPKHPTKGGNQISASPVKKRERNADFVYKRRQKYCQGCGADEVPNKKRLELHHLKPLSAGGSEKDGFVTLCHDCHRTVHTVNGKLRWSHVDPELTQKYIHLLSKLASEQ